MTITDETMAWSQKEKPKLLREIIEKAQQSLLDKIERAMIYSERYKQKRLTEVDFLYIKSEEGFK